MRASVSESWFYTYVLIVMPALRGTGLDLTGETEDDTEGGLEGSA